jgi:hypothetical protein
MDVMFSANHPFADSLSFVVLNYYLPESEHHRDELLDPQEDAVLRERLE